MNYKQTILLVEDDKIDIKSAKRAFDELHVTNPLYVTQNGEEALQYLKNNKNKKPGLILLDLRMPRMESIEFLKVMKQDDDFKITPVVVLITPKEQEDKIESFEFGVSGYMVKPVDYKDFVEAIRTISMYMYWTLSETSQ